MDGLEIETMTIDSVLLSGQDDDQAATRQQALPYLPPTEKLLLEGGDARIAIDSGGTSNKYGCRPRPDPDLLAFGSSTASVISSAGFAAAERLRRRVLITAARLSPTVAYTRELERMRQELIGLCGVADLPGLDVIFAASGTDLHLIAAQLSGATQAMPTRIVMVDAEETGSGVAAAVAGRHFSSRSALGKSVEEGVSLMAGTATEVVKVKIRAADGTPRPTAAIDADVETLVNAATSEGRRVMLILVDVSKTGMIAPSPACALALRQRLGDSLEVLVDACQFRLAPSSLRGYLAHGCMVALTGSKFLTGPTFSGALLVPPDCARRLRRRPLPRALAAYSSRAEWPAGWDAAAILDNAPNFGLLLRWEAALQELRTFRTVPETRVVQFLQTFALAIASRLKDDPVFEALPVPRLERGPIGDAASWDRIPTIFPFLLCRPSATGKQPLSREQTMQLYHLLQSDLSGHPSGIETGIAALRCQLGQPVACGVRGATPVSALRVCASSRLIVEAGTPDGGAAVIRRALAVLDKAALLVRLTK